MHDGAEHRAHAEDVVLLDIGVFKIGEDEVGVVAVV